MPFYTEATPKLSAFAPRKRATSSAIRKFFVLSQNTTSTLAEIALQSISNDRIDTFECSAWRSNGFSDSAILRLTCALGAFSIRSWPNRFDTPSKIEFWAATNETFNDNERSLKNVGASTNIPFPVLTQWKPHGDHAVFVLPFEDKLWTLCSWVQGQPIASNQVDKALVVHLATVLGRLHARPLGLQSMQSNSLRERLEVLKSLDHRLFSLIDQTTFFSSSHLSDRLKHCMAIVLERGPDWQRFLSVGGRQMRACHWIVRDLWRENILLDDSKRFSSIVDLGAARIDWPGLDFIRLFGSLSYDSGHDLSVDGSSKNELWQDAFAAYTNELPSHAIESLEECKMMHMVSVGLSIAQWVRWIQSGTIDLRNSEKAQRVSERIRELCDQFLMEAM